MPDVRTGRPGTRPISRAHERVHEDDDRERRTGRKPRVLQDGREVDGYGHEEQSDEGGGRTRGGDEEVRPGGEIGRVGHGSPSGAGLSHGSGADVRIGRRARVEPCTAAAHLREVGRGEALSLRVTRPGCGPGVRRRALPAHVFTLSLVSPVIARLVTSA